MDKKFSKRKPLDKSGLDLHGWATWYEAARHYGTVEEDPEDGSGRIDWRVAFMNLATEVFPGMTPCEPAGRKIKWTPELHQELLEDVEALKAVKDISTDKAALEALLNSEKWQAKLGIEYLNKTAKKQKIKTLQNQLVKARSL